MATSINASAANVDTPEAFHVFIKPLCDRMTAEALQEISKEIKTFFGTLTIPSELENNKKFYTKTISTWNKYKLENDRYLVQCYYKLAVISYFTKAYASSISHVKMGLDLLPNYVMLYFVRAKAYIQMDKKYLALSDILHACILVEFKIDEFNNLLKTLATEMDSKPDTNHGSKAFNQLGTTQHINRSLWEEIVTIWKLCEMCLIENFSEADVTYQSKCSFFNAMRALYTDEFMEIVPACDLEIASKGNYRNEARLLRALMHSQIYKRSQDVKTELKRDLKNLEIILQNKHLDENFRMWTRMCKASVLFALRKFATGNNEFISLISDFPDNGLILFWRGYECCTVATGSFVKFGLKYFDEAEKLIPDFYLIKFYKIVFEMIAREMPQSMKTYFNDLKHIIFLYPFHIYPRVFLIGVYTQMKKYAKAGSCIRDFAEFLENERGITLDLDETDDIDLVIEYLKGCIRYDPNDYGSYFYLYEIYLDIKQDYGKSLEVLNEGLKHMSDSVYFEKLFDLRHKLLVLISEENFWDRVYAPAKADLTSDVSD